MQCSKERAIRLTRQRGRATAARIGSQSKARIQRCVDPIPLKPQTPSRCLASPPCRAFALTQPVYSTSMPQSWRRPQHQKRTWAPVQATSALPPKADIAERQVDVRFVPKADIAIHSFQISRDECQPHSLPAAFINFIGHFGGDRPPERPVSA
jgi:hypothetical protein